MILKANCTKLIPLPVSYKMDGTGGHLEDDVFRLNVMPWSKKNLYLNHVVVLTQE